MLVMVMGSVIEMVTLNLMLMFMMILLLNLI